MRQIRPFADTGSPQLPLRFSSSQHGALPRSRCQCQSLPQLPLAFTAGTAAYLIFLIALWPWRLIPLRLTWRIPGDLAIVARLAFPLLIGSIAQQLGLVGLRLFASQLVAGTVTAFDLAYRLGVAIVEVSIKWNSRRSLD